MSFKNFYALACTFLATTLFVQAQECKNWMDSSNKDELENTHMFYRDAVKKKDFAKAYPLWKKVYEAAPAADGKRASHYADGRTIIKNLYAGETDAAKKKEMLEKFVALHDEEYACYPKDKKGKDKKAYLLEAEAFDLYYTFNHYRDDIFKVLEEAREVSGDKLGYSVIYPYADIICDFYTKKKADAAKVREISSYLNKVCDTNIKSGNPKFKAYYEQQKGLIEKRFAPFAKHIYGCDYFANQLRAKYEANPNDKANYEAIYNELVDQHGCTESNALVKEIGSKIDKDNAAQNAKYAAEEAEYNRKVAERNKIIASQQAQAAAQVSMNSAASEAQEAAMSGDYATAESKYLAAIAEESDASKKALYHYNLAVVYGRKMNKKSKARTHAKKAISLDGSNGKPYLLLGDLYAGSARSCGSNGFEQRMVIQAAMKMWRKAKNDGRISSEASQRLGQYAGQLPDKETVFMNGKKVGGSYTVGCWINETIMIRAK